MGFFFYNFFSFGFLTLLLLLLFPLLLLLLLNLSIAIGIYCAIKPIENIIKEEEFGCLGFRGLFLGKGSGSVETVFNDVDGAD